MPANPDTPKSGRSRRRRILKRAVRILLVISVLAGVALIFLPQIATQVIAQLTGSLALERFEVTVVDVKWNEATLTGLDASDTGWQARAEMIVVGYAPWDLVRGKVQNLTLHGLHLAILEDEQTPKNEQTPGPSEPPVEPRSDAVDSPPYAWLHRLPETFANCPEVVAPGARLTIPRGTATIDHTVDLALGRPSSRHLSLSLESEAQRVTADLEGTASGSTLTVQVSVSDPRSWLTTTETLLGAASPYLPPELLLGPVEATIRLPVSDAVDAIEVTGSMKGLRYATAAATLDARSSLTTFEGVIRPGGQSQVGLRGDLSACALEIDALPGETFTLPADSRPVWTTRFAWDSDSFSYDGGLENLRLRGGEEPHRLEVTHGAAVFSNRESLFRTKGNLHLNGLGLPFDFVLNPADTSPERLPNATLELGPVTLDAPQPLLSTLLPSTEGFALTGTFESSLALRLAPDEPVSGNLEILLSETTCNLAGEFVALGPLSGKAQVQIPADDTPPAFRFEGAVQSLALDTTDTLGFPLAHRHETPAAIQVHGELPADAPRLLATVRGLSLEGEHHGHEVRFSDTSLDIDYRGPTLKATALTHFGTAPLACTYEHTIVNLLNDQWQLRGVLALSSAMVADPITNAGAFSELLDGMSLAGKLESELDFQAGSDSGFEGALLFKLSDCTAALEDDMVVVTGFSGTGSVTIPAGEETPVSWKIGGTAGGLAIDTSPSLGFPLAHTADPPAAFTISGTLGENATTKGHISKLTLDGAHRGEFVSFAETTLDFRHAGETLSADGRTHYAGNEIPFSYTHTREVTPDKKWTLNGQVDIPLVSLGKPVTNAGAFSDAAAGMRLSGKTAVQSIFHAGSDDPFRGTLDFMVADGTLTLPDDGATLTGISTRFVTPDLDTLHTVKAEQFTVGALTYGDLSFTKLSGRYQIHPDGGIALSGLKTTFLGGRLTIDPFTYPADDGKQFRMDLRFEKIDLGTLTALFPAFDGKLDGKIDGHLPLLRKDGAYLPERGGIHLTPRTKARLRYNADALFTGGLEPGSAEFKRMKLAEDSLTNLSIPILTGRFFDPGDKDKAAVIRIEGQSPVIKDAPPIHLNFNIFEPDGEARQLLDYFFKNREKLDFGL